MRNRKKWNFFSQLHSVCVCGYNLNGCKNNTMEKKKISSSRTQENLPQDACKRGWKACVILLPLFLSLSLSLSRCHRTKETMQSRFPERELCKDERNSLSLSRRTVCIGFETQFFHVLCFLNNGFSLRKEKKNTNVTNNRQRFGLGRTKP